MPTFVSGLDLSRCFFQEIVRPLLANAFPELRYAAALLGPGSEVLGFDTEMSIDHDWGPRLFIFLREEDAEQGALSLLRTALAGATVGLRDHRRQARK